MLKVKDWVCGLLAVGGVALLCCEAGSLIGQALAALGGFALWGAAGIIWQMPGRRKTLSEPAPVKEVNTISEK